MKKTTRLFVPVLLFSLSACSSSSVDLTYHYEEEDQYQEIWDAPVIYNEPVVFVEQEDGSIVSGLLYEASKIISFRSQDLKSEYSSSCFRVEGKKITLLDSIRVPYIHYEWDQGEDAPSGVSLMNGRSGKILFTENASLIEFQIAVTYYHKDKWEAERPSSRISGLPELGKRLSGKESINLTVYGDSIFVGCNATGWRGIDIAPYQEPFDEAFARKIQETYGCEVNLTNVSLGGAISEWGRENVSAKCASPVPDLALIGFGMNDGSGGISPDAYTENIRGIIEGIRKINPDCSVIISSSLVPNPLYGGSQNHRSYLEPLQEMIEEFDNAIVMDATTMSSYLGESKNSYELFANNVNHPTDWVIRAYVAMLMKTIS